MAGTSGIGTVGTTGARGVAAESAEIGKRQDARRSATATVLEPLLVDLVIPFGGFYLLHDAVGMGLVLSLALGGVVPAVRTFSSALRKRTVNGLAGLILVVNLVGIALSFVTGDPRLMIAKDSGISSVIGVVVLLSVVRGTPMMSAALKPFLTQGKPQRVAAWDRLSATDPAFRHRERLYSAVWGVVLLVECTARIIGAYALPVTTMVWLGNVILMGGILTGMVLSGALAANQMRWMVQQPQP